MPEGTPGRKSFKMIPTERKQFWRPEALSLREVFPVMAGLHIFFILSDIFIYNLEILILIADILFLWLDFYNFMIINKVVILIEIIGHLMVSVVALSHIQRGLENGATKLIVIVFVFQFFAMYPIFVIITGRRLKLHHEQ